MVKRSSRDFPGNIVPHAAALAGFMNNDHPSSLAYCLGYTIDGQGVQTTYI